MNFFLIEIHAYQIGDSLPAPKFEIVEKPNDFVKRGNQNSVDGDMTRAQSERLFFWEEFNKVIVAKGKPINLRKASTDHWYDIAIGSSDSYIVINLVNKDANVVVELYIPNKKTLYDKLYAEKSEIENELGLTLDWNRLDNKKASRIKYYISGLNFDDHSNYPELMSKVLDTVLKMRTVFKNHI